MTSSDCIWAGLFLAGTAAEIRALRGAIPGGTLSECTRAGFRVHTRAGRIAFGVTWVVFSSWFLRHILTCPEMSCPSLATVRK